MITVIKATGEREAFNEQKVMNSIRRARIPNALHQDVLEHVKSKLYEGISTEEIYRHILEFLERSSQPFIRSRYGLKESIMMLGPTGYPFEDFVARILEAHGYTTQVRQILRGRCVSHEIDVIAKKNGKASMIELKFHNSAGTRSEVQVALYTFARFEDVQASQHFSDVWLVTNTKATIDAITYAECMGMKVISWSYPENGGSLRDLVESARLHPITIIHTLSQSHKATLLQNHIVLCKDILRDKSTLDMLALTMGEREQVIKEVEAICSEENL
jgi:Holliday junction resolvase-like predicted endonuclease